MFTILDSHNISHKLRLSNLIALKIEIYFKIQLFPVFLRKHIDP